MKEEILKYLKKHRRIRVRDISKHFHISWHSAKYYLEKLEDEGYALQNGKGIYICTGDIGNEEVNLEQVSLRDRVLDLLSDGVPRKPIDIARVLRIKKSTARSVVNKLFKEREIKRLSTGYYVHKDYKIVTTAVKQSKGKEVPVQYVMPRFEFHGIKLEYHDEGCKNVKFCNEVLGRSFLERYHSPDRHRHPKNRSITQNMMIELEGKEVMMSVTIHRHLIEIWIKNTEQPIGIEGFNELIGWLKGAFYPLPISAWKLTQIGVNEDLKGLRVDGVSNVTLQEYRNMVMRIYNKKEVGLRREIHVSNKRDEAISLERAMEIFRGYDGERILKEVRDMKEGIERERSNFKESIEKLIALQMQTSELLLKHIESYTEERKLLVTYLEQLNSTVQMLAQMHIQGEKEEIKEDTTYIH